MAVDDSINYVVDEDIGSVNVTLLLDQPSCLPITVIARPQESPSRSATGKVINVMLYL